MKSKGNRFSEQAKTKACILTQNGMSPKQVADQIGCHQTAVYKWVYRQWCKEHGVVKKTCTKRKPRTPVQEAKQAAKSETKRPNPKKQHDGAKQKEIIRKVALILAGLGYSSGQVGYAVDTDRRTVSYWIKVNAQRNNADVPTGKALYRFIPDVHAALQKLGAKGVYKRGWVKKYPRPDLHAYSKKVHKLQKPVYDLSQQEAETKVPPKAAAKTPPKPKPQIPIASSSVYSLSVPIMTTRTVTYRVRVF